MTRDFINHVCLKAIPRSEYSDPPAHLINSIIYSMIVHVACKLKYIEYLNFIWYLRYVLEAAAQCLPASKPSKGDILGGNLNFICL